MTQAPHATLSCNEILAASLLPVLELLPLNLHHRIGFHKDRFRKNSMIKLITIFIKMRNYRPAVFAPLYRPRFLKETDNISQRHA